MLILAFDTTSPEGSAVLFRGAEQVEEIRSEGKNYSVALFEMVDRLLAKARARLAQVELFAAATGPGSFTGIRVGLSAAQGWATALGRPVVGVSVLDAMLEAARPAADLAVPVLDARRNEFYLGIYRRERAAAGAEDSFSLDGDGIALDVPSIGALAHRLSEAGVTQADFVARENDRAALALSQELPGWIRWRLVSPYLASAAARLAWRAAREDRLQQPRNLDAFYIRRSDAEVNWPDSR